MSAKKKDWGKKPLSAKQRYLFRKNGINISPDTTAEEALDKLIKKNEIQEWLKSRKDRKKNEN